MPPTFIYATSAQGQSRNQRNGCNFLKVKLMHDYLSQTGER